MKNRYYLVLIALLCFFNINLTMAQDEVIYIYPQVQELTQNGDAFSFDGFQLKNYGEWSALVNRTTVEKMLASSDQNGLPLKLEIKDDIELWQNSNNLAEAEGAYILSVNKNQVSIAAEDSVGIFYGLQTLRQLVKDGKIYPVEIKDFPTVKYRGVVEGFYGTPWSQEDRMSQIKFYGRVKANTYIYGPKDDPYHSSPNWRKPYPPKQAANIKKLVKAANANFVDFVWAIHPGQDIKWNEEDRENVLKKFESMYDLGVRSFAVFFDDISGIGTDAHKQAALLNYLTDNFVKVKKGVKPLILTPTDYNKSWANPDLEDGYLAILGKELDPSVQIMWTGDQVMSDVTESTLAWVKKRIQRPALVWWNFPVSDYERNQLFIGPSYGLEKNINGNEMAGILSNPMEHAEASKPAIYGVADYGWNTATYNPEKSWEHSLKILLPHSYKAYKLFGENNSNPSSGITSYIGKESEDIAPYLTRIKEGIKKGDVNREDMIFTEGYFLNIRDAGSKIIAANDDPMLLEEVTPWLNSFTALGQEGINQLENYKYHAAKAKDYWHRMLSDIENSNYWHPDFYIAGDGTKTTPITGSRVLRPFIDFLQNWNSQTLFTKIVGEENVAKKALAIGQIHTNIAQLKDAKLVVKDAKKIAVQPNQKSLKLKTNDYFTVELSNAVEKAEVELAYKSKENVDMQIEASENGEEWEELNEQKKDGEIITHANHAFRFFRISNEASESIPLELNKLTIKDKENQVGASPFTTRDFNLSSAFTLKPGERLTEKSLILSHPEKAIILAGTNNTALRIKVNNEGKWKNLPGSFTGDFIEVNLPEGTSAIRIYSPDTIQVYEVLWK